MRPVLALLVLAPVLILTGCSPRTVASLQPDAASQANNGLARLEKAGRSPTVTSAEGTRKMDQLFGDHPDYVAIRSRGKAKDVKLPRVRSIVPPASYGFNQKALVTVAYIVDERGRVVDARVYESNDSRFDKGTVAAVKQWSFYPGSVAGVPAKFVIMQPFSFAGLRAH